MKKIELLKQVSFGKRIAEEEKEKLKNYFVETDEWRRIYNGEIDIIYGTKGSGKSAIYSILTDKIDDLFEKNILLISGEHPRGTPVFKNLNTDPPASQEEFLMLWKLYLVLITANQIIEYDFRDQYSLKILELLREMKLIPKERTILNYILYAIDYGKRLFRPSAIEGGISLDQNTAQVTGVNFKITPGNPNPSQLEKGFISIDSLMNLVNQAMLENDLKLWIAIDRLDVAFTENQELENRALRSLFKVYLDILPLDNIKLKIFLRDDIWRRITEEGFREASHITRNLTIRWTSQTILNLIVRRLLANQVIIDNFNLDKEKILSSFEEQKNLFYNLFPDKIEIGEKQSSSLNWIESRIKDAKDIFSPREVIHLLNEAKNIQIKRIEIGEAKPINDQIIDRFSIKEAMNPVSETRLTQTVYAEYPSLKPYISKLSDQRTEQSFENLCKIWELDKKEGKMILEELVEVGFIKINKTQRGIRYKIPFLYRPCLNLVQGSSDNQ